MIVIPAIDIKNGKCVRLVQGDYSKEKIYSDDPLSVAKDFEKQGAKMLHIVDLDAAKDPKKNNREIIERVVKQLFIPIEVGGGVRDKNAAKKLINAGVKQVIIGTMALENPNLFAQVLSLYSNYISVAIDVKDKTLVKRGWIKETNETIEQTIKRLQNLGVKRFVYTDVLRDGMMSEPNYTMIERLRQMISAELIIGGGISSIEQLKKLKLLGIDGVIIGKAMYEGKIDVKEAVNVG